MLTDSLITVCCNLADLLRHGINLLNCLYNSRDFRSQSFEILILFMLLLLLFCPPNFCLTLKKSIISTETNDFSLEICFPFFSKAGFKSLRVCKDRMNIGLLAGMLLLAI